MTVSEAKRKLAKSGCTFTDGTKHTVVYYKGKRSLLPRHPSKEIKRGTWLGILKDLGLKE